MNVYRQITRTRVQFDFLTFNDERDGFYDEIIRLGGRVYFLPGRRAGLKTYHRSLDGFFFSHAREYYLVHFHAGSFTTLAPLLYAKRYGISRRIAHIHSDSCNGFHNRLLHRLNVFRLPDLATDFLGCSRKACEWGFGLTKCRKQSQVIRNGIDLDVFRPDNEKRKKTRAELGLGDSRLILHVGSFNEVKNQKFLIKAFSRLAAVEADVKLMLVGDGPRREEIISQVDRLGLSDRVIFPGHRDDVADLMRAADLFVFPSFHEGLGLVAIEAQACGLPVLASEGVPEEAEINYSFERLPLKAGAGVWAAKMRDKLEINDRRVSVRKSYFSSLATWIDLLDVYTR